MSERGEELEEQLNPEGGEIAENDSGETASDEQPGFEGTSESDDPWEAEEPNQGDDVADQEVAGGEDPEVEV